MKPFKTNFGSFFLERIPQTKKGDLRAWDAADELLLNYLAENQLPNKKSKPLLIINDAFGALSTALHHYTIHNWSDSFIAHLAVDHNAKLNQLVTNCRTIPSSQEPSAQYDLVIIKIPKTLALLEDQLYQLEKHISANSVIVAAAMSKHIHTSTLQLFEKFIGTTTTSRATKKARLIFPHNNQKQHLPTAYPKTISDSTLDIKLINYANVFSKDQLDIGARFLIEQLKHCPPATTVIDLGCGNGILGIMAQRYQPRERIHFIDESYLAIKSAQENYLKENPKEKKVANFILSNCLSQYNDNDVQLILCNPPFHQAHSMGDQIAWEMFQQSLQHLETNGELWVVGNRHLAYHNKLKRLFGNCKTIASNKKFVVLAAQKK